MNSTETKSPFVESLKGILHPSRVREIEKRKAKKLKQLTDMSVESMHGFSEEEPDICGDCGEEIYSDKHGTECGCEDYETSDKPEMFLVHGRECWG